MQIVELGLSLLNFLFYLVKDVIRLANMNVRWLLVEELWRFTDEVDGKAPWWERKAPWCDCRVCNLKIANRAFLVFVFKFFVTSHFRGIKASFPPEPFSECISARRRAKGDLTISIESSWKILVFKFFLVFFLVLTFFLKIENTRARPKWYAPYSNLIY